MLAGNLVNDHALRILLLPIAARAGGAPDTCGGDGESYQKVKDHERIQLYSADENDLEIVQRQGRQYLIDRESKSEASQRAESSRCCGNVAKAASSGEEQCEARLARGRFG